MRLTAAVDCAPVVQATSVTSANIVGYQQITVASGYNIFTPTFKNISSESAAFDLTDIQPLHQDGNEFGTTMARRCNGAITINKINNAGNYTTSYSFFTLSNKQGWYAGETKINTGDVTLNIGEAILVYNGYKSQPVIFRVTGEVDLVCVNNVPSGYALYGNSTPTTINLSDIVVLHQDGNEFGTTMARRCNGAITINKISAAGNYTTAYSFFTLSNKQGWYAGETKIEGDSVTFKPGEAFLIYNGYKSQPIKIQLPKTITE